MKNSFMKIRKGETIIEVITALSILVLAGLTAVTVVLSTMYSIAISKEYLIAQNLAREGIEGVINIRDTNWMLYPSNIIYCWMTEDSEIVADAHLCRTQGEQISKTKQYILDRHPNGKMYLDRKDGAPLDFEANPPKGFEYELLMSADGIYTHGVGTKTAPAFYRMITFEEVPGKNFVTEAVKVVVKIQWMNKDTPKTYELKSIITNYEKN